MSNLSPTHHPLLSIVVPTFREAENVSALASRVASALGGIVAYELIFVDDSDDETSLVLAELSKADPRVKVFHRNDEKGLATAVVEGFRIAQGDIIAVMDADLQHSPDSLPIMYRLIKKGHDMVIPSRYVPGGQNEGLSGWIRKLSSKTAILAGKLLLPPLRKVTDPTSGFFMMQSAVINEAQLNPIGWKILIEVLIMGNIHSIAEFPFVFEERHAGASKLTLKVTLDYFRHLFQLRKRRDKTRAYPEYTCYSIAIFEEK